MLVRVLKTIAWFEKCSINTLHGCDLMCRSVTFIYILRRLINISLEDKRRHLIVRRCSSQAFLDVMWFFLTWPPPLAWLTRVLKGTQPAGGTGTGGVFVISQGSLCARPRQLKPQENSFFKKNGSTERQTSGRTNKQRWETIRFHPKKLPVHRESMQLRHR